MRIPPPTRIIGPDLLVLAAGKPVASDAWSYLFFNLQGRPSDHRETMNNMMIVGVAGSRAGTYASLAT